MVNSYLKQRNEYHRTANKVLHKSLTEERDRLAKEIHERNRELKALVEQGHIELLRVMVKPVAAKEDDSRIPSLEVVSEEQYARVTDRLMQADLDLIDAQAKLDTARLPPESRRGQAGRPACDRRKFTPDSR